MNRYETGRFGEKCVAKLLQKKGFTVVAANWHCRYGEIDIIAAKSGVTVFIEVKTIRSMRFCAPEDQFNSGKLHRVIRSARLYMGTFNLNPYSCRLDLACVEISALDAAHIRYYTGVAALFSD